jgi:hypothetical protein
MWLWAQHSIKLFLLSKRTYCQHRKLPENTADAVELSQRLETRISDSSELMTCHNLTKTISIITIRFSRGSQIHPPTRE